MKIEFTEIWLDEMGPSKCLLFIPENYQEELLCDKVEGDAKGENIRTIKWDGGTAFEAKVTTPIKKKYPAK